MVLRTDRKFVPVPDFERTDDGKLKTFEDPNAQFDARDQRVRERMIAVEHTKILREQLIQCYRAEGVNHYQNCKDIVEKYIARIRAPEFGSLAVAANRE